MIHERSIEKILAASMYIACRRHNVPRTLDEIESVTRVEKRDIAKMSKLLAKRLWVKLPSTSPLEYVSRFCAKLNLAELVEAEACEVIKEALEKGITSERGPTGIAASAIYIAANLCGDKKTQKMLRRLRVLPM